MTNNNGENINIYPSHEVATNTVIIQQVSSPAAPTQLTGERVMDKKTKRRLAKLDALEAGGVDNWEWYGESLKDWFAENEKEEIAEKFVDELLEIIVTECEIDQPAGHGCGYGIDDPEGMLVSFYNGKG